jgi:hypothetical protein
VPEPLVGWTHPRRARSSATPPTPSCESKAAGAKRATLGLGPKPPARYAGRRKSIHPYSKVPGFVCLQPTGGGLGSPCGDEAMHHPVYGLPRTHLLRTRVNKGKEKGCSSE